MTENKGTRQESVLTIKGEVDTKPVIHIIEPLYEEQGAAQPTPNKDSESKATLKLEDAGSSHKGASEETWCSIVPEQGSLNVKLKDCSDNLHADNIVQMVEDSSKTILNILSGDSKGNPTCNVQLCKDPTDILKWKVNRKVSSAVKREAPDNGSTETNSSQQSVNPENADTEPPVKIAKTEDDSNELSSVISQTPCVLKRTANNELVTANGGIILNDDSPSPFAVNQPGVDTQKTLNNQCPVHPMETAQAIVPKAENKLPLVVTSNGLESTPQPVLPKIENNVIIVTSTGLLARNQAPTSKTVKIENGGVQSAAQQKVPQTGSIIIKQEPGIKQESGIVAVNSVKQGVVSNRKNGNTVMKQKPTLAGNSGFRLLVPKLENEISIVKQEPVIQGINSTMPNIVPKTENGVIMIKQEPETLAPNSTVKPLVLKLENVTSYVNGIPTVKQTPPTQTPKLFSHKSWNGLGSCGPSNEVQQITTTVSVKRRNDRRSAQEGNTESDVNVMCIRCKEIFTNMESLNVHLKKTKHGDVNNYFYSSERWREVAHKKRREILQACQGKAWVGPTPNHLSFGPLIPEDQLPETVYKCTVCGGIYHDVRDFRVHEAWNSCNHRKRLQESLLQQFESKPIDKSLKPLL